MSKSIRYQIIAAIASGLSSVRKSNGYNTDCGITVKKVQKNIDIKKVPAFNIWPGVEISKKINGKNKTTMPVRVEGFVAFTNNSLTDACDVSEDILSDIKKRMESQEEDITSGLADHVEYAQGGVDEYPDAGDTVAGVSATYNITYKTKIGDPSTS